MKTALVLLALAACTDTEGTLTIKLVTAPDSTLLASVQHLRLTLTNPPLVFETERTSNGLDLSFSIDAVETNGVILVEGLDVNGSTVMTGQSPPFPLAGTNATVGIYVAPPFSILEAPHRLPPRSHIGATSVLYGAVMAGGLDESGAPTKTMTIYNIYNHAIDAGADMPVARAGVTLAANDFAAVYVLGGSDETSAATSTLYRFQTNIAPDGGYYDLGAHDGLESTGQRAIKIGSDAFFVTGSQPALLGASTITPIANLAGVSVATAATTLDGTPVAAFLREGIYAVQTFAPDGTIGQIDFPTAEPGRAIVASEPGTVIVVGGATRTVFVVDLTAGTVVQKADTLSTQRRSPAVAKTSHYLVIAGGDSGTSISTADILDASTYDLLLTVPLAPRANAMALAMPNDQVMIVGGDEPTGLIELFTPPTDPAPQ